LARYPYGAAEDAEAVGHPDGPDVLLPVSAITRRAIVPQLQKGQQVTANSITRSDVFYMIKRRAKGAVLPYSTCCHIFRATGITVDLHNGGALEHAQQIAAHQSPRTTKLCYCARVSILYGVPPGGSTPRRRKSVS
jgi:hypothetical protein